MLFINTLLWLYLNFFFGDEVIQDSKMYLLFDAGSSKTRLYYFKMIEDPIEDWTIGESFEVGKFTALSRYNEASISSIDKQIAQILNEFEKKVNSTDYASIPIYLRATAGLRSLNEALASKILDRCKRKFQQSKFKYVGDDSAKIFTGQEEGLWLWVFMNYVLGKFKACGAGNKVEGFDMGGGSTQVATLKTNIKYEDSMAKDIVKVDFGCPYEVYSVSYEPAGSLANRKKFFANNNMKSDCMAKGVKEEFKFGDFKEIFEGTGKGGEGTYEKCLEEAIRYADDEKIVQLWSPEDIPKDLYLVSGFFYITRTAIAVEKGCTSLDQEGCSLNEYTLTVDDIRRLAKLHCTNLVKKSEIFYSNYLCIDLVWLEAVLSHGYGITNSSIELNMIDKINGHSAGWPLGFVYGLARNSILT